MSKPIKLTDDQLAIITRAAEPLHYTDRGPFLEVVAARLRGVEVLGDGVVARVVRQTAAEFFRTPEIEPRRVQSRWDRDSPGFERTSKRTW